MLTRRQALTLALGTVCATLPLTRAGAEDRAVIDTRVNLALRQMYASLPRTKALAGRAVAMLVMPDVLKGGFLIGGSYGEGALMLNDPSAGYQAPGAAYYSVAAASLGLQVGVQSTSHVLFFMTEDALARFRRTEGWEIGADAEVTLLDQGANRSLSSTSETAPVVGVVFGRQGAMVGASLEGAKYTEIPR